MRSTSASAADGLFSGPPGIVDWYLALTCTPE
jgi:hypothetical protein